MIIYVAAEGLGEELALDTETPIDDELVRNVKTMCLDAAVIHNFTLPKVEELISPVKKPQETTRPIKLRRPRS
jgi:hypothetical protein